MRKMFSLMLTAIMLFSMSTVAFAATTNGSISESEKKELYGQYQAAVKEAIAKYDARIDLKPLEKFDFENAAPLDEFKATLKAIGESKWHNPTPKLNETNAMTPKEYEEEIRERLAAPRAWQQKTKKDTVTVGTRTITINITGQFETYYSEVHDSQLISGSSYISDITASPSSYTWHSTFLDESLIDGGRTFYMADQGYVEYSDMYWYDLEISAEFYCSATGKIS